MVSPFNSLKTLEPLYYQSFIFFGVILSETHIVFELVLGSCLYVIYLGNMEKVSALVIDAKEPMTLNENGEDEIAFIKDEDKKVIWKSNQ